MPSTLFDADTGQMLYAGKKLGYLITKPRDKMRLDGSLKGFEECRGKGPAELEELLGVARTRMAEAFTDDAKDYWYWRCRESEIEWVCNVVSAALRIQIPGAIVTAGAHLVAAKILAKGDGCLVVE